MTKIFVDFSKLSHRRFWFTRKLMTIDPWIFWNVFRTPKKNMRSVPVRILVADLQSPWMKWKAPDETWRSRTVQVQQVCGAFFFLFRLQYPWIRFLISCREVVVPGISRNRHCGRHPEHDDKSILETSCYRIPDNGSWWKIGNARRKGEWRQKLITHVYSLT